MKTVLTEINRITTEMETNYPELYLFLGENPATLYHQGDREIQTEDLLNYLESLHQILKHHIENLTKLNFQNLTKPNFQIAIESYYPSVGGGR